MNEQVHTSTFATPGIANTNPRDTTDPGIAKSARVAADVAGDALASVASVEPAHTYPWHPTDPGTTGIARTPRDASRHAAASVAAIIVANPNSGHPANSGIACFAVDVPVPVGLRC